METCMQSDILEKFYDYLKSHGMRITQERDEILKGVYNHRDHFTATDVHKHLQQSNKNIGLATVYRTLPLLVRSGLICEAGRRKCKEEQSYEIVVGQSHHDHLICEVCGMLVEFEEPMIEKLQLKVADKYGFRLRRHYLDLRGVCPDCQKRLMDKAMEEL